jgi:hypothetical protein
MVCGVNPFAGSITRRTVEGRFSRVSQQYSLSNHRRAGNCRRGMGYELYQDRKQPEGMRIDVGPNGLKIDKK